MSKEVKVASKNTVEASKKVEEPKFAKLQNLTPIKQVLHISTTETISLAPYETIKVLAKTVDLQSVKVYIQKQVLKVTKP